MCLQSRCWRLTAASRYLKTVAVATVQGNGATVPCMYAADRNGLTLTATEQAMLDGSGGPAVAMAMRIITGLATAVDAPRLRAVDSAHIDSCLYHGQAGLDFAKRLVELGGRVAVPSTLNVGSLDLIHPDLVRADTATSAPARELMDAYLALGCSATWTCAPYQAGHRPAQGSHVAWAESNAIAFVNSVLGARTERYGDFADIAAAVTGRVPDAGLHRDEHRRAQLVIDCAGIDAALLEHDAAWGVLGHLVGELAGSRVVALTGLPDAIVEDRLKALGAAAASSGGVALFHVEGVTPEAPSLADVLPVSGDPEHAMLTTADLQRQRHTLSAPADLPLDAVSIGTPHFSLEEFADLAGLLDPGTVFAPGTAFYVSTSRAVADGARERGYLEPITAAGATIVTDTCTYITPILEPGTRHVMTNSGKWAWYAPANLGVQVTLGSLEECVRSAVAGRSVMDRDLWGAP